MTEMPLFLVVLLIIISKINSKLLTNYSFEPFCDYSKMGVHRKDQSHFHNRINKKVLLLNEWYSEGFEQCQQFVINNVSNRALQTGGVDLFYSITGLWPWVFGPSLATCPTHSHCW